MFDRVFSAALAFCVLAGGTLAVGTAMLEGLSRDRQVVQLPRVEIHNKRPVQVKIVKVAQAGDVACTDNQPVHHI